jgi:hypothetical protein
MGLPQRLGKKKSRLVIAALLIGTTILLHLTNPDLILLIVGLIGALLTAITSDKLIFKVLIITVLVDLVLLINAANSQIGSLII